MVPRGHDELTELLRDAAGAPSTVGASVLATTSWSNTAPSTPQAAGGLNLLQNRGSSSYALRMPFYDADA